MADVLGIRRWTSEDVAALRRMAGNQTVREIARELRRTPGSVSVKAHELRMSLRTNTKSLRIETGVAAESPST